MHAAYETLEEMDRFSDRLREMQKDVSEHKRMLFDQKFDLQSIKKVTHSYNELQTRIARVGPSPDNMTPAETKLFMAKVDDAFGKYARDLDHELSWIHSVLDINQLKEHITWYLANISKAN